MHDVLGVLGCAFLACCLGCEPPAPQHPPDQLLRDSLGLTDDDPVLRIEITTEDGEETPVPGSLTLRPGSWVEFVTNDARVHTVAFDTLALGSDQKAFLRERGEVASPPLLSRGTRFVVTFRDAPLGRYPFMVEGTGRRGTGAILIALEDEGGRAP